MRIIPIIFPVLALLFSGCVPTERFWWSPDGLRAVVVLDEGLRLVDEEGKILVSEVLDREGARTSLVESVSWLPDGSEFLSHRILVFDSWKFARAKFPADEAARIEQQAISIPLLIEAAALLDGDAKNFDVLLGRLQTREPALLRNAFFLALETDRDTVEAALAGAPGALSTLDTHLPELDGFVLHRIDRTKLGTAAEPGRTTVLVASATPLKQPRCSPDGTRVAFGRQRSEDDLVDLVIARLSAATETSVAQSVFPSFAWSSDGGSLFTVAPVTGNDGLFRQLRRIKIEGDDFAVENLAVGLMPFDPRVEVLADGSVLFAAQKTSLPAASFDELPPSSLFRLDPERVEIVRIGTSEDALPANLGYFVASPDGSRIAVVESDTDAVAVVELGSGELTVVSAPTQGGKCRTLPAWRNDEELTYAALDQKTGSVEWRFWTTEGERGVLGSDWEESATANWIEKGKGDSAGKQNP